MKAIVFAILDILSGLLGLVGVGDILFQLEGVGRGIPLETSNKLATLAYALLTVGLLYISYWLFRRALKYQDSR